MIETKKELKPLLTSLPFGGTKMTLQVPSEGGDLGEAVVLSLSKSFKHILSHQVIFARFWEVAVSEHKKRSIHGNKYGNMLYIFENQLNKFAFPRLIEKYFDEKSSEN